MKSSYKDMFPFSMVKLLISALALYALKPDSYMLYMIIIYSPARVMWFEL